MAKKRLTEEQKRADVDLWIIILVTFAAFGLYSVMGMALIVKKKTGNAWGCVFAFCFIWNAM